METGIQPSVRRATTLPSILVRPTSSNAAEAATQEEQTTENLFYHPRAKIFEFPYKAIAPKSESGIKKWHSPGVAGSLPWTALSLERVASVGLLRIYKVPGSVSFIASGDLLLTLFTRSQCWCVDGESRFAIILNNVVYRIELPFENDEDRSRVEDFKTAIAKVLRYEKTACPFRRGFTVDVPDEDESAIPKGPAWSHIKLRKTRVSEPLSVLRTSSRSGSDAGAGNSGQDGEGGTTDDSDDRGEHFAPPKESIEAHKSPALQAKERHRSVTTPVRQRVKDLNARSPSPSYQTHDAGRSRHPSSAGLFARTEVDQKPDRSLPPHDISHAELQLDQASPLLRTDSVEQSEPVVEQDSNSPELKETISIEPSQGLHLADRSLPDDAPDSAQATDGTGSMFSVVATEEDIIAKVQPDQQSVDHMISYPRSVVDPEDEHEIQTGVAIAPTRVRVGSDNLPPQDEAADGGAETRESDQQMVLEESTEPVENSRPVDILEVPSKSRPRVPPPSLSRQISRLSLKRSRSHLTSSLPPTDQPGLVSRSLAVLLGPPSGLVQVMLEIARRVSHAPSLAGLWRFKLSHEGESDDDFEWYRVPGAWISSEELDRAEITQPMDSKSPATAGEDTEGDWSDHSDFDTVRDNHDREQTTLTRRKMRGA